MWNRIDIATEVWRIALLGWLRATLQRLSDRCHGRRAHLRCRAAPRGHERALATTLAEAQTTPLPERDLPPVLRPSAVGTRRLARRPS